MVTHENISPTLATTHYGEPVVCYPVENHPNDSRVKISKDGTVQTLSTRMGTGGGMLNDTVNALCASDRKGIGNQYVNDGKVIIEYEK